MRKGRFQGEGEGEGRKKRSRLTESKEIQHKSQKSVASKGKRQDWLCKGHEGVFWSNKCNNPFSSN